MIFTGFAVFLGLVFIFAKLKRRTALRLLHHDLWLDLAVMMLTLLIHWGSFEGIMAATIAGLLTSVGTTAAKKCFGHIEGDLYHPGLVRLAV